MHERMEFPWKVEEAPCPVVSVDIVNALAEALEEAHHFLLFGDDDGPVSGSCDVREKIEAALAKAGVEVPT